MTRTFSLLLVSFFFSLLLSMPVRAQTPQTEVPISGKENRAFKDLDETILQFIKENKIPGCSITVLRGNRLVYARGYGWADKEDNLPALPDTKYRLASVSKVITALAVLRLIEAGKLKLEDKALPLLNIQPFHKTPGTTVDPRIYDITIRNLLQHRTGWDRDKHGQDPHFVPANVAREMHVPLPVKPEQMIAYIIGTLPLDYKPGEKEAYGNTEYTILGRIVEKVSGVSYEEYVKKNVLLPLGITDMYIGGSRLSDRHVDEARYYAATVFPSGLPEDGGKTVPAQYGGNVMSTIDSSCGWVASAVDLSKLLKGINTAAQSGYLSRKIMSEMIEPPVGVEPNQSGTLSFTGLGPKVYRFSNGTVGYSHFGRITGSSTVMSYRAYGVGVCIVMNSDAIKENPTEILLPKLTSFLDGSQSAQWPTRDLFPEYAVSQ